MNLDELHKVMKGDMTVDQACEGMTDDFEIGHVSHRADGDYRKVAQGKWVPVKAGGQGQMKQGGGDTSAKPASGIEAWKKDEGVAGRDLYTSPDGQHKIRVNRNYLAGRRTFSLGTKENGKWERKGEFDTIEEAVAAAKPQGGNTEKPDVSKLNSLRNQLNSYAMNGRDRGPKYQELNKQYKDMLKQYKGSVEWDEEAGSWAETKAAEGAKPAEQQGGGTESDGPNTAMQDERSQFKFRKHITHAIPMGKQEEIALNRISSYFESGKRNASDAIDNYADHLIKENMEKGNNNEAQERAVMRIAHAIGYGHELHDKIKRGRNGYDFGYADEQGSFYEGDDDGFLEPNITEPEPDDEPPYEYDNPAPRMSELSISEETGRDKFMDKLTTFSEKYNDPSKVTVWKTEKGNWDTYYDGHRLGIIGGDQINDDLAKKLGWYQGNYANDAAAPRLTRDTKIRLSRIKREQTQDERRTYKIGEISEKTGLQKTANGWREVKKGASPAGGKMSKEDLTKRVGEMLKTDPTMRKMVGAGPAPKADPAKMSKEQLTQRVSELMKTDKNLQKVVKAAGGTIPGGKAQNAKQQASPIRKADFSSKNPAEIKRVYKPQTEAEAKEMNEISRFMKEETGADLGNALMARESYYKNTKNPTPEEQQGLAALMRIMGKVGFEKED